ncbi:MULTISPECIES: RNA-guided endonuclease InsQ/TnpB family protein [unclassified Pseudoalteromonas]|jgi:putative transposase|uniref:RNA-guided endonuclease InsQ/TnpB family protein n=2 Tax=Pseudoalteromonas TaxID=53246 RepID=UPI00051A44CF|nr:RNA-guided endonuclease TnpB family protein [Pseudoalteromonas sp. ND6B]KGJ99233.1 transposase IS891/IS1136/IS1341 family [Pseudoalteromonas sp. ND6B]
MKKTLRYNYRLNPTPEQEAKLVEFGATARGIWNLLLSENMRRYEHDKTFLFYKDMASLLKDIKTFEEFNWIKAFDSAAAQQVARDLELALKNVFTKGRLQRFPKHKISYKKKKLHNDSFRAVNNSNCIRIENGAISIPKVGKIPIILHRKLASKIKTVTIQYHHGKWGCSITQEVECKTAKQVLKTITGFDINSKQTVVGSDGFVVDNPTFLKQSKTKLNQLQRQLARRTKGSNRWQKTKQRINKLHGKISRQRLDFAHKISRQITNENDILVFEDLNVKGMQKFNGSMVADNVMGLITQLSKYKTELEGKLYHEIGRFEKSTGVCSECGQHHVLTLNDRYFTCTACETNQSRDLSAAKVIAKTGELDLIAAGIVARVTPTSQQKSAIKTKVFELSKFAVGTEKKEAA